MHGSSDQLKVNFVVITTKDQLEKSIVYQIREKIFDLDADFSLLLNLAPDLTDYAWQDDPGFTKQREAALDELFYRLGGYAGVKSIPDNLDIFSLPFQHLWLSHIFDSLSKAPGDIFETRKVQHYARYRCLFREINHCPGATDINRTKLMRG